MIIPKRLVLFFLSDLHDISVKPAFYIPEFSKKRTCDHLLGTPHGKDGDQRLFFINIYFL